MHAKPNRDTVPQVTNGRINGRFAPGYSGNPGGSPEAARKALNKDTPFWRCIGHSSSVGAKPLKR